MCKKQRLFTQVDSTHIKYKYIYIYVLMSEVPAQGLYTFMVVLFLYNPAKRQYTQAVHKPI